MAVDHIVFKIQICFCHEAGEIVETYPVLLRAEILQPDIFGVNRTSVTNLTSRLVQPEKTLIRLDLPYTLKG